MNTFYQTTQLPIWLMDRHNSPVAIVPSPLDLSANHTKESSESSSFLWDQLPQKFYDFYRGAKHINFGSDREFDGTSPNIKSGDFIPFSSDDCDGFSFAYQTSSTEFWLLIGPFKYSTINSKLSAHLKFNPRLIESYLDFPLIPRGSTAGFSHLLTIMFEELLSPQSQGYNDSSFRIDEDEQIEKSILEYREIEFYHHDYYVESNLLQKLSQREIYHAFEDYKRYIQDNMGRIANNDDRSTKNLHIIGIGLLERKAIELGVNPHIAFTVGDTYLRKIETCDHIGKMDIMLEEAYYRFHKIIQKQVASHYSPTINSAIVFIDKHLTDQLSLKMLANYLNVDPSYLSRRFKEEVHMTFSDYVKEKKIEEAQRLLHHSHYSIAGISDLLGYSSASYFTRCFKSYVGVTPHKFKHSGP